MFDSADKTRHKTRQTLTANREPGCGDETEIERYLLRVYGEFANDPTATILLDWLDAGLMHDRDPADEALLVNGLLGLLASAKLNVRLPDIPDALETVIRSGLPFALANREGTARIAPASEQSRLTSAPWRRSWTMGTRSAWVSLLGESPESLRAPLVTTSNGNGNGNGNGHRPRNGNGNGAVRSGAEAGLYGPHHAIFVNPHRSHRAAGSEQVFRLVALWLGRLLEEMHTSPADRDDLLDGVRTLIDELIQNVRGHATRREGAAVKSLVKMEVRRDAQNVALLLLTVQDTGPGIAATVRSKLDVAEGELEDDELIERLVLGDVKPRGRARGIGLPQVLEVCKRSEAQLMLRSRAVRVAAGPDGELRRATREFDACGTAVVAMLPLGR